MTTNDRIRPSDSFVMLVLGTIFKHPNKLWRQSLGILDCGVSHFEIT